MYRYIKVFSIYLHACAALAFHGKSAAKADHNPLSSNIYFNRIDYILRQGQDGQTIGVPVGPDASRIVAEVLACAVDREFNDQSRRKRIFMVRHVDDVWIGAPTYDEAERLLYLYRSCLREYELDINELKTSIIPAFKDVSLFWPKELIDLLRTEFRGTRNRWGARKQERMFALHRVFHLTDQLKDDGIIKFALRRLDSYRAWLYHWDILEPFLVRCVANFPHSIDYVARVVAWRIRVRDDVDIATWQRLLHDFVPFHARLRNDSEVTWGLWLAQQARARLNRRVTDVVVEHCGALPLMLLYSFIERGKVRNIRNQETILGRLGDRPLAGPFWIFAYEGWLRGWMQRHDVAANAPHDLFENMVQREVSFFAPDAMPSALEGKEEEEWLDIDAIEDIAGEYEDDEEDEEEDEDF